jgi:asparagine synthetase B (glutamine-hydrolysing)
MARAWLPGLRSRRPAPVPWLARGRADLLVAPPAPPWLLPGRQQRARTLADPLLAPVAEGLTAHAARHGVELRHPLLDHRLFELAARLPTDQSFRSGVRKIVVRNAMRGSLPAEVVDRPDKIYPDSIVHRGLRERERDRVWSLMTGMRSAALGYVDEPRLHQAYRRYLAGETRSALFWHTLTLEAWLRRFP